MSRTVRELLAVFLPLALVIPSLAQQPAKPPAATDQPIKIKTSEVLLDVVVHDKKGRPIRDLKPEEIEVYEDGVKQSITKFSSIGALASTTGTTPVTPPEASPEAANSLPQLRLVTLLFDHLTVQRVQAVRDAGFNFVDNSFTPDMLVRVMVVGRKLYLVEQFTNDRAKLRKAVERATGTVEKSFADNSDRLANDLKTIAGIDPTSSAVASQPSDGGPANGGPKSNEASQANQTDVLLAKLTLETLAASEKMAQETKSNLHVFSLLPFSRPYRQLPGRKMVLYFSDGLYMPAGMNEVLRSAVSEANRANLTFYAVNTRGLLAGAGNVGSRLESSTVINQSRRPDSSAYKSDLADSFSISDREAGRTQLTTNFNTFEVIDRNKEINKQGPLAELTEGTGGFLITSSNDLNGALKRVAAELGQYYALSYLPSKQEYDGKFRAITVKVLRSGLKAQTRSGYFALPPTANTRPVLTYETPLLAALNDPIVPHDFAFRTGTLRFESRQNEAHNAILVELPLANFVHEEDKEKKTYPLKFAVLGMVKDEKGEITQRFSEPHQMEVPTAAIESVKKSAFTLARHFWLSPGRYTLETVVHDQAGNKISAQRQTFAIPAPKTDAQAGLQTGSLFLVKQIEQIDKEANNDPENPLITEDKRILPELEQNISTLGREDLSFHLPIFPNAKSSAKTTLRLELWQEGKMIATTSPELPKPDAKGRIAFTAGIAASSFVPGKYRFRALVNQGNETVEEATEFTITGERKKDAPGAEEKTIASSLTASDKVGELTLQAMKTVRPIELSPLDLLQEVEKSGAKMHPKLGEYTYSLRKVRRVLTAKGKIKSEDYQDYEAYPVKGKHALIQLAENGNRLSLTRIDISRKSATDTLIKSEEERQKLSQDDEENLNRKIGYWGASIDGAVQRRGQPRRNVFVTLDPEVFFRSCEFSSPRMLLLAGRETIAMDFRPRTGVKLGEDMDWVQKLAGTVWIDAADRALVRIEGHNTTVTTPEGSKEDSAENAPINFVYQQQRLDAGVWGPSLIRINAGGDENLFRGLNWDAWFEFTNFKRFDAHDSDVKILSPEDKKPQK